MPLLMKTNILISKQILILAHGKRGNLYRARREELLLRRRLLLLMLAVSLLNFDRSVG